MRFSMRLIVAGLVCFVCREQPDPLLLLLCSLPQDGDIRVATEEAPSHERYPCPLCRALCHSCLLGEGGTVRALPFWSRPQDSFSHTEAGRRLWLDIKNSRTQHRDA